MNDNTDMKYSDIQASVDQAHRMLAGEALGDTNICVLIKHSARLLTELMNRQLREFGLSYSSYVTLMCLAAIPDGHTNPSLLCERAGETRANMTRICDELVELNLIERKACADDRRRINLSLTDQGIALLRKVVPKLRACARQLVANLEESEKAQLKALLGHVVSTMESQI